MENDYAHNMTSERIKATVIIAAWTAEDGLERSVRSALNQKDVALEVIVVDDASPDGTYDLAKRIAADDSRVRTLRLPTNQGPAGARNAALEAARGGWIAVLDADDTMVPDRLARMIALGERMGVDAVYDDFRPVGPNGEALGPSHLSSLRLNEPEIWTLERFLSGCQARAGEPSFGYLKPIIRRQHLQDHRLRYDVTLRNGEDFHLVAALLAGGGTLAVLPEPGYLYTRRPGSVSARLDPTHAIALAGADRTFAARKDLSPEARNLMRTRRTRLDDLAAAEQVLSALKRRDLSGMIRSVLGRPRAVGRLAMQVWEGLRRRFYA